MALEIIGYFLALFVGLVLGTLGGGGSILAVPILVVFFQLEPQNATVYSLFIVGVTSLFGAVQHFKSKLIHPKNALLFGIPAVISISLTRLIVVPALPPIIQLGEHIVFERNTFIMSLFGILMILASIPMIKGQKELPSTKKNRPTVLVIFGGIIGLISGLVGAGGGFMIIPSLSIFMKVPIKNAIATSIVIIAINSLSGFTAELFKPNLQLDWILLLGFTLIATGGLILGLKINHKIQSKNLKKGFGFFVLLIGVSILIAEALAASR
ncbi:sulfite exporter TauE/SafE family protein [Fluviicola sp.]|uniref:sulfite exporter TauE/SafE family protein n=1 Tax=Fluviicola sp. TaxID=1917219 RepID=UPI00260D1FBC|nr:sulfite exporter TauE/SafE family protein [Fluviicola sp.]